MFESKPIRETDRDGALLAAGFRWTEVRRDSADALAVLCAVLLMAALAVAVLDSVTGGAIRGAHDAAVISLLVAAVCAAIYPRVRWKRRSMVFLSSGAIEAPEGMPGHEKLRVIPGSFENILSIESHRFSGGAYGVRATSRAGRLFNVARDVSESDALHIAVQLNLAMNEFSGPPAFERDRVRQLAGAVS